CCCADLNEPTFTHTYKKLHLPSSMLLHDPTLFRSEPSGRTSPASPIVTAGTLRDAVHSCCQLCRRFTCATTGRGRRARGSPASRSEEHTSELQSRENLVCRLLLEKKK